VTTPDYRRKLPKRARRIGGPVPTACPSGKRSWLDRHSAVQAARRADGRYRHAFDVYRCRDCRQYHLTSRLPKP